MREIKFRAWDKKKKEMIFGGYKEMIFGGYFKTLEINGNSQEWFGMPTPHPDDCELMQYTGHKDKNGKEIYKGDIVQWGVHKGEIVWFGNGYSMKETTGEEMGLLHYKKDYEIIGNIYENPDLL